MLEQMVQQASGQGAVISMGTAFGYAAAAGGLGLLISLSYLKTGKVSPYFARTLVLLPMMVCVVMTMVNGNLGTLVAIMGAFSLVRFRSLQGSSRDIGYIFFAMMAGLTCSMGYLLFASGISLFMILIQLLLAALGYGTGNRKQRHLRITIPEHLDYSGIFEELFEKFTGEYRLTQVKTTNLGSLYELEYELVLKDEGKEKEFLDEIRCRNGNLTVICGRRDLGEEAL